MFEVWLTSRMAETKKISLEDCKASQRCPRIKHGFGKPIPLPARLTMPRWLLTACLQWHLTRYKAEVDLDEKTRIDLE